jgi:hypothetical protein
MTEEALNVIILIFVFRVKEPGSDRRNMEVTREDKAMEKGTNITFFSKVHTVYM